MAKIACLSNFGGYTGIAEREHEFDVAHANSTSPTNGAYPNVGWACLLPERVFGGGMLMKRGGYSLIFLLTLIAVVAALSAVLFPAIAGTSSILAI